MSLLCSDAKVFLSNKASLLWWDKKGTAPRSQELQRIVTDNKKALVQFWLLVPALCYHPQRDYWNSTAQSKERVFLGWIYFQSSQAKAEVKSPKSFLHVDTSTDRNKITMPLGLIKFHRDTRETSDRRPFPHFFGSISKESPNPLTGVAHSYTVLGGHKARGWHTLGCKGPKMLCFLGQRLKLEAEVKSCKKNSKMLCKWFITSKES